MLREWRNHRFVHVGPMSFEEGNALPTGLCRVVTTGFVAFAFLHPETKDVISMFSLEPGKEHIVKCPADCHVIVECEKKVKWIVRYSNRFNRSDPTRIEAPLVRPLSPQEEMQSYFNEVAARALGGDHARLLRNGQAVIDTSKDNYDEYSDDDEGIPPLTKHQLGMIIEELQYDVKRLQQIDIESVAPPVPLKDGKPAKADIESGTNQNDSKSDKSGEVKK